MNLKFLLSQVTDSNSELNTSNLGSKEHTKMLGIFWSSISDIILKKGSQSVSISQIFDPLGLLSPCVITAKILLQKLWLERLSWDESVPASIYTLWVTLRDELKHINHFIIPRHVRCIDPVHKKFHTFSVTSEKAYGACTHIRTIDAQDKIHVYLLCAKFRVCPIKALTIPRLELCGALIAAKLSEKIQRALTVQFSGIFRWTDSTIVLG
ncbi:hypothetical protein PPYR_15214 [Photinus pyralis]|uniref:Uncharacterized protein n=1 Tax=Photinus pyralis TaxID=7054 RepID=A0A5N3ZZC1_PHOPY|nr:hypothetical protein PPYR_15214 [Photinus pyralis]